MSTCKEDVAGTPARVLSLLTDIAQRLRSEGLAPCWAALLPDVPSGTPPPGHAPPGRQGLPGEIDEWVRLGVEGAEEDEEIPNLIHMDALGNEVAAAPQPETPLVAAPGAAAAELTPTDAADQSDQDSVASGSDAALPLDEVYLIPTTKAGRDPTEASSYSAHSLHVSSTPDGQGGPSQSAAHLLCSDKRLTAECLPMQFYRSEAPRLCLKCLRRSPELEAWVSLACDL